MPGVPGVVYTPWAHGKMLKVHRMVQNPQLSLEFPIRPSEALGAGRQDRDGVAGRVEPELSFGGSRRGREDTPKLLESANPIGGVSMSAQQMSRSSPSQAPERDLPEGGVASPAHVPGVWCIFLWHFLPLPVCGYVVAPQDPPQPAWFSSLQVLACEQEI